jgi:hypothetical protein
LKFPRVKVALFLALLSGCPVVAADTVAYQRTGEFGEAAFSDIKSDESRALVLPQSSTAPLSSAQQIEQMLRVAQALEAARLDRSAQRDARRAIAQQANPGPEAPEQPRNPRSEVYPYTYPYHHPRKPHDHADRAPTPSPATPTKTFRFQPDL